MLLLGGGRRSLPLISTLCSKPQRPAVFSSPHSSLPLSLETLASSPSTKPTWRTCECRQYLTLILLCVTPGIAVAVLCAFRYPFASTPRPFKLGSNRRKGRKTRRNRHKEREITRRGFLKGEISETRTQWNPVPFSKGLRSTPTYHYISRFRCLLFEVFA